jgi:enterochelin esterase-like enzyme
LLVGGSVVCALGGGLALVDRGVLPGQARLNRALGRCDVTVPAASVTPGPAVRGVFDSARRRRPVNFMIVYPPNARPGDRLPVCLVLHGYGGSAWSAVDGGRYDRHAFPFVLAAIDGGPGYWHPHPADDPLGALLEEFVPLLGSRYGLAVDRYAVLGWSMGGYGALLAAITQPSRVAAAVASSPAIWRSYAEAHRVNPGAFESAAEWGRYDLIRRAGEFHGLRVRVDCGDHDPFTPGVREFRERLPDPSVVHLAKGCHDDHFWQHVAPEQLRFLGDALSSLKRT